MRSSRRPESSRPWVQGSVKEFTERYLIEDLSSEKLGEHLSAGVSVRTPQFGLELVSLTVQSVDAVDLEIAEAIRRRESARIFENTELLNQKARVAAARLAEAGQNLKNARTVVSLWTPDTERDSGLSGLLQRLFRLVLEGDQKRLKAEGESEAA
jgi:hypothetical protein